jgi:glyoxylase-like metal-dependent hydrolase (beta-lactamase superfamily II)
VRPAARSRPAYRFDDVERIIRTMKRALKIVGLLVLVLVIAVVTLLAVTFMGRQSITDGAEAGGLRIVKDGVVSVGVIPVSEREIALVDAGNDKEAKAILAELSRRHLGPDAVTTILITHGHPDHTGGVAMFPKAQVISLETERPLVEGRIGAKGPLTRLFPVSPTGITVTKTVADGDTLMLGPHRVRVFAVPGHTQGSAAYLVDDVLFMGDAADTKSDGTIIGSPWVFSDSQPQDRASLVALDARLARDNVPVKVIAFAHSGLLANGRAPLDAYAATHK